jgi:hypothetical protein
MLAKSTKWECGAGEPTTLYVWSRAKSGNVVKGNQLQYVGQEHKVGMWCRGTNYNMCGKEQKMGMWQKGTKYLSHYVFSVTNNFAGAKGKEWTCIYLGELYKQVMRKNIIK